MKEVKTRGLGSPGGAEHVIVDSGNITETNSAAILADENQIKTNTDNLQPGQDTMANSVPVVIASNQSAVPVSVAALPLPTGAATEATLLTRLSESDFDTKTGSLTEAAPATDTASSGLNGRLQRIAQRITTLIAFFRLGQGTMAQSLATTIASDQTAVNVKDIITRIQTSGAYEGKTAYVFNILGQRNGFTSTSAMDGVKEYDNAVSDFATTSNSTLDIISSNANDTAAGTGVRTVKVTYIDNSNNLVESASITLNGTTLVTSVLTGVNQVLWMETATAGSGGVAAGNIRLRINGGVVEVEQITAGGNKSRSAIFKVPTGYTGYLVSGRASAINNDQDIRIRAQANTLDRTLATTYHYQSQLYTPTNTSNFTFTELWLKLPATCTIKINTISAGTASTVRCNINMLIVIIAN